jgi:hypothetical protein
VGGAGQGSRWQGSPRRIANDEGAVAVSVAEKGSSHRRGLGGEDEVQLLVPCKLHRNSGEPLGVEVEAEGVLDEAIHSGPTSMVDGGAERR